METTWPWRGMGAERWRDFCDIGQQVWITSDACRKACNRKQHWPNIVSKKGREKGIEPVQSSWIVVDVKSIEARMWNLKKSIKLKNKTVKELLPTRGIVSIQGHNRVVETKRKRNWRVTSSGTKSISPTEITGVSQRRDGCEKWRDGKESVREMLKDCRRKLTRWRVVELCRSHWGVPK